MIRNKNLIRKVIVNLLDKAGIKKAPVEIERIARLLKVEIRKHPYKGNSDLSGILVRDQGKVVVGINSNHHEHRQRFSIAHEIGHYLLHEGNKVFVDREYKVNFRDSNSSLGTNIQEIEANIFASLLLIPENLLLKDLSRYEIDVQDQEDIQKFAETLADKYNVSPTSMMLRLSSIINI